jgi:hypothetical protein
LKDDLSPTDIIEIKDPQEELIDNIRIRESGSILDTMGTEVNSDSVNPMNKKRQKIEENLKNALRQLS